MFLKKWRVKNSPQTFLSFEGLLGKLCHVQIKIRINCCKYVVNEPGLPLAWCETKNQNNTNSYDP
jgi:hypothetical protein